MLTIRQTLFSILLVSSHHLSTTKATDTGTGIAKSLCAPSSNTAYPNVTLSTFISRSLDFCNKLGDAGFGSRTIGYRGPVMTISFLRNEACEKLNREDCMGKLRELSESCKSTAANTNADQFLHGHSSLPTFCGTYNITLAPVETLFVGNTTFQNTTGENKKTVPTLTDNSSENMYEPGSQDDGSGYVNGVPGKIAAGSARVLALSVLVGGVVLFL